MKDASPGTVTGGPDIRNDFVFYEHAFEETDTTTADFEEVNERLQLPYGRLDITSWHFDGILVLHTRNTYDGHYRFYKENRHNVVNLSFNLKGSYQIHHLGQTYTVRPRQHNMVYTPGTSNTFTNTDLETETFAIQIMPPVFLKFIESSNQLLGHFADQIREGLPAVLAADSLTLHPELQKAIHELLGCHYQGPLKKLFLLSKSLEILVMQTDAFLTRAHLKDYACTTPADRQRILFAGEYLVSHLAHPPNLSELARIAGLNEYKLKRGFREVFHQTVFGYLSGHRLELSRQLLLDTDKTAAEIAFELGYASPQHFNNAFKTKFGVTPKKITGYHF